MATGTYTNNPTATQATYGENSPAVLELQKKLNSMGANLALDSRYGPQTKAAYDKYMGGSTGNSNTTLNFGTPDYQSADDYMNQYNQNMNLTQSEEDNIRNNILGSFQGEIDAARNAYATLLKQTQQQGVGRLGENTAMNARRGLMGSDFGAAQTEGVRSYNLGQEQGVLESEAQAIASIMARANEAVSNEINAKRAAKATSGKAYLDYLAEAPARKEKTISNLTATLFTNGIDPTSLDKKALNEALKPYAGLGITTQDILNSYLTEKQAREQADLETKLKNKPYEAGGYIWQADPETGAYKKIGIQHYKPESSGAGGGDNPQLYAGLSSPTATAVRAKVGNFKSEPQVQNFATIQDGYNFAKSISDTTTNPADDQALIYSLAKALDPGSVVREGEYATAQKYAQSWVKAYGKKVTQAIAGTGFLSEEARKNIKKTIEQKYNSTKKTYDNLYSNYSKSINSLTGRQDADQFLIDYNIQNNTQDNSINNTTYQVNYGGKIYNVDANGDMTPA